MDAKSRANFINAVADGTTVPCPKCGRGNKPGSRFCAGCGAELEAPAKADTAFAPVKEEAPAAAAPAAGAAAATKAVRYEEPSHVFAEGLPDWSLEPPMVMVRRR